MDLAGLPCIAQSDDELSELSCVAGFDDDVCIAGRESSDIDCCFAASARRPSQQRLASSASRVFAFSCLTFVVKDRRTRRERKLLDDVGARCDRATTTAVMGPSGSGKTTLISLLTLRAPRGRATGRVTLGGLALTQRRFRRLCFVVNQDDELWPTLTPREQLRHATQLFAAAGADIEPGRAEEIIDRLGLASCADTFVGHALVPGGLSGGQKRRLSIGVALVKQPVAAFLDEPTSGLDAAASLHTMAFVRSLAKDEHLIVVATIHQPSTKVFLDFDNLLLLSEGRVAWAGDGADRVLGAEMAAVARGERAGRREAEAALAGRVRAVAAGRRLPADVQCGHLLRVAAAHGGRRSAVGRGPRGGREVRRGGAAVAREVARVLARVRVVEGEGVGAPPVEFFPFVDRVDGGGDDGGEDGAAQDHAQQAEARPRPVVFSLDHWHRAQRQPLVFRVRRHPVGAGDHV